MVVRRKQQASGVSKTLLIMLGIIVIVTIAGYVLVKKEIVEPVKQNVSTAESKARDATRKSALADYAFRLEVYRQSVTGNYPISLNCISPQNLNKTLDKKVDNPPTDPLLDASYSWTDYCYQSDANGSKYTVWSKVENGYDSKTSQINTTPYFPVPSGFEPNYYFMQSEE